MSYAGPSSPYVTTPDERTMGTLAHVLQLVTTWMGPLFIFLIKRLPVCQFPCTAGPVATNLPGDFLDRSHRHIHCFNGCDRAHVRRRNPYCAPARDFRHLPDFLVGGNEHLGGCIGGRNPLWHQDWSW